MRRILLGHVDRSNRLEGAPPRQPANASLLHPPQSCEADISRRLPLHCVSSRSVAMAAGVGGYAPWAWLFLHSRSRTPSHPMNSLERSRQISRVFSRPVLESIARTGNADDVARELRSLGVTSDHGDAVVGDLFEASLAVVESGYRCEY